jgi:hypothetical protein
MVCQQRGMTRTQFYDYKRRLQTHGLAGLQDLPPIAKSHPFTTPAEVWSVSLPSACKTRPGAACGSATNSNFEGVAVSSPTVQNILIKQGLASRYDRLLRLKV